MKRLNPCYVLWGCTILFVFFANSTLGQSISHRATPFGECFRTHVFLEAEGNNASSLCRDVLQDSIGSATMGLICSQMVLAHLAQQAHRRMCNTRVIFINHPVFQQGCGVYHASQDGSRQKIQLFVACVPMAQPPHLELPTAQSALTESFNQTWQAQFVTHALQVCATMEAICTHGHLHQMVN